MLRRLLASALFVVCAAPAFAVPIAPAVPVESGGTYLFVTSSSAPEAYGTTTVPPVSGLGAYGGLCVAGVGSCPNLDANLGIDTGVLGLYHGAEAIELDVPSEVGATSYEVTLDVQDNLFAKYIVPPASTKSPSPGNIYEVTVNGVSLGTTSIVNLTGDSSGTFTASVSPGMNYIGITDLLEPYANGLPDDLPGVLGDSGLDAGDVSSAKYSFDIVQLSVTITTTPEPASLLLLGAGTVALLLLRRRPSRHNQLAV